MTCVVCLQDVKFPLQLDVFDLCSPELQQKLIPMRDRFKEEDEKQIEKARVGGECVDAELERVKQDKELLYSESVGLISKHRN